MIMVSSAKGRSSFEQEQKQFIHNSRRYVGAYKHRIYFPKYMNVNILTINFNNFNILTIKSFCKYFNNNTLF